MGGPQRTPQGGLRIPASLTRSGVLEYQRADGSIQREWRPAEEVFAEASLASLRDAPVTDLHPPEMVGPETFAAVTRGNVSGTPTRDGDLVAGELVVQGSDLVKKIDDGDAKEISPGYVCRLDMTPGTTPEGEDYDAIQRSISYNHVAIGPEGWGRSGARVSLRTDSTEQPASEAWRLDSDGHALPPGSKGGSMTVKKKDEGEVIVPPAENKDAESCPTCGGPVDAEGKHAAPTPVGDADVPVGEAPKMDAHVARLTAKVDSLTAELNREKAKKTDEANRAKFDSAVQARVDLVRLAEKAGVEKTDGTDDEIRRAVIAKVTPQAKLDGKNAAYIEAAYDLAVDQLSTAGLADIASGSVTHRTRTDASDPAADPIKAAKQKLRNDGVIR